MQALILACCLSGVGAVHGAGVCPTCPTEHAQGKVKGAHYKHAKPDGVYNGMPQSCYDPRYGCYPGNNRHLHRHPAFHGSFYRSPYNYRTLHQYPWRAMPFEPEPLTPGH